MSSLLTVKSSHPPYRGFVEAPISDLKLKLNSLFSHERAGAVGKAKTANQHPAIFLTSNETRLYEVSRSLLDFPSYGNTVLGVSGLQLLLFFVHRPEAKYIINFDPDERQKVFWDKIEELFAISETPEEFRVHLRTHIEKSYSSSAANVKDAREFLSLEENPLFEPSAFFRVKDTFKKGFVIKISLDLSDFPDLELFAKECASLGLSFDTLYISNIQDPHWLGSDITTKAVNILLNSNFLASQAPAELLLLNSAPGEAYDGCAGIMPLFVSSFGGGSELPYYTCTNARHLQALVSRFIMDSQNLLADTTIEAPPGTVRTWRLRQVNESLLRSKVEKLTGYKAHLMISVRAKKALESRLEALDVIIS
ncbi:MAG: hypothetical protein GWP59_05625, partial [Chlamydiales bacterium]|nr:hypothetical protein [Chlamydiales bacterium]